MNIVSDGATVGKENPGGKHRRSMIEELEEHKREMPVTVGDLYFMSLEDIREFRMRLQAAQVDGMKGRVAEINLALAIVSDRHATIREKLANEAALQFRCIGETARDHSTVLAPLIQKLVPLVVKEMAKHPESKPLALNKDEDMLLSRMVDLVLERINPQSAKEGDR